MNLLGEIKHLLAKDILIEWRQSFTISGIILYLLSTIFLIYMSFQQIESIVWICLYWLVMLFTSISICSKSFIQEQQQTNLYYYQIARPIAFLLSKIIYNAVLLCCMAFIALLFFQLLFGVPYQQKWDFFLIVLLGNFSLAINLTSLSAIAAKASHSGNLLPVLGFPILIPIIALIVKISLACIILNPMNNVTQDLQLLITLNAISLVLALILFPYLWQD